MPRVMKENKQLTVTEEKVGEFLQLGYSLINEKGEIIKPGTATSLQEIKAENDTLKAELVKYKEAKEKIENVISLEQEIATIKAENEALKVQLEAVNKKSK